MKIWIAKVQYIYIYDCLKTSERGLQLYNFKITPIITHWARSNKRINNI